jgi:hypothetical protein
MLFSIVSADARFFLSMNVKLEGTKAKFQLENGSSHRLAEVCKVPHRLIFPADSGLRPSFNRTGADMVEVLQDVAGRMIGTIACEVLEPAKA